jgi:hypothetical protein
MSGSNSCRSFLLTSMSFSGYAILISLRCPNSTKRKKQASIEVKEDIMTEIQNEINRQLDLFGQILQEQIIPG